MSKGQKKGFLLPPAVGYSFSVLFYLFTRYGISLKYLFRTVLTVLINVINWPFRTYERLFINKKYLKREMVKAPVFIIGHWRSGTTHLHNILCQDPQMGYTTTYQSVFPDTLFNKAGRFIFEGFARILIPGTRQGDNVRLGTALPQEEEFALGDKTPVSFYYFWMFPVFLKKFYDQFVRFEMTDGSLVEAWKNDYRLLISKALANTGGERFLSKNPTNTGRIEMLLSMYPDARFIHIHRNPIEVFLSTKNFFLKMLPHLQMQSIDSSDLEDLIFDLYKDLMHDYLRQRDLIPPHQLMEISFDDLERDPMTCLKTLYQKLELNGYSAAENYFQDYLKSMKSYQKNKHHISASLLEKIQIQWSFTMKKWGYEIPENIKIDHSEET